jgi:hypothetical protein
VHYARQKKHPGITDSFIFSNVLIFWKLHLQKPLSTTNKKLALKPMFENLTAKVVPESRIMSLGMNVINPNDNPVMKIELRQQKPANVENVLSLSDMIMYIYILHIIYIYIYIYHRCIVPSMYYVNFFRCFDDESFFFMKILLDRM